MNWAFLLYLTFQCVSGQDKKDRNTDPPVVPSGQRTQPSCGDLYTLPNSCQNFARASVNGINDQIRVELNASYVYMAMSNYFGRDDVSYRGVAKFFRKASEEEREHAQMLMDYLNKRGGKLHLKSLHGPDTEYGTPLQGFETALTLEKHVNQQLLDLHWTAQEKNDPHLQDFLEGEFLTEQVDSIKQLSDFVTILRRTEAHPAGTHIFDEELYNGAR